MVGALTQKNDKTREPKLAGFICISCSEERLCHYGSTLNVAHTVLGSTPTGTVSHVPGKPSPKSQSDIGNGVSPTSPAPTPVSQGPVPPPLGAEHETSAPGAGFVVDEVLHAKATVI